MLRLVAGRRGREGGREEREGDRVCTLFRLLVFKEGGRRRGGKVVSSV